MGFVAIGTVDERVRLAEHIHWARHVQGLNSLIDDDRDSLYRHLSRALHSDGSLCRLAERYKRP